MKRRLIISVIVLVAVFGFASSTAGGNGLQNIQDQTLLFPAFGTWLFAFGIGMTAPVFKRMRVRSTGTL